MEVFRCTPVLVQLVWFYYALPVLTGIEMSATMAAALCLSLYGGAFYAEIIRGGVIATDMTGGVKEKYDRLIAYGLCVQRRWGAGAAGRGAR